MTTRNITEVPQQTRRRVRNTRRMTLHRLVEEVRIDDVLNCLTETCRKELNPELTQKSVAGSPAWLVHKRPPEVAPEWSDDLGHLADHSFGAEFRGSRPGALLFVEIDGRLYVVPFGSGYTWLEDSVKDQTFGLALAIRCMDPSDVSDIVRRSPGRKGRTDSTQVPGGSHLWGLGLDTVSEMVRKLNGRSFDLDLTYSRDGERAPKLEAAGSVSTHLGLSPQSFVADIRALEKVLLERDVAPEFAFVDNVRPVTFPDTLNRLSAVLEGALTSGPNYGQRLALAVPTDLQDVYPLAGAFQVRLGGGTWMTPRVELTIEWIEQLLQRLGTSQKRIDALSHGRVRMLPSTGASDEILRESDLFQWIEASVSIGSRRYTLLEGKWYELGAEYLANLQQDMTALFSEFRSAVTLPAWRRKAKGIETEGEYNERVGKDVAALVTMDKVFVRGRADRPWRLEVCDLLARDGTLIHVKPAAGSDVLSHLFNQGLVSAEALLQADVREQFLKAAAQRGVTLPDDYEPKRIVFAILLKTGQELSETTLFPFAQLALRHTARILAHRGIRVELVGIRLGDD